MTAILSLGAGYHQREEARHLFSNFNRFHHVQCLNTLQKRSPAHHVNAMLVCSKWPNLVRVLLGYLRAGNYVCHEMSKDVQGQLETQQKQQFKKPQLAFSTNPCQTRKINVLRFPKWLNNSSTRFISSNLSIKHSAAT